MRIKCSKIKRVIDPKLLHSALYLFVPEKITKNNFFDVICVAEKEYDSKNSLSMDYVMKKSSLTVCRIYSDSKLDMEISIFS